MKRLLAVTVLGLTALAAAPASANHVHLTKLTGDWTNPVGACVNTITKFDPATGDVLACTGTSDWTGTWRGSTTWKLHGRVGLTTGGSGHLDEVFTGRSASGHKGKLTFSEHFTIDPSGKIDIKGTIVKGSGRLGGSTGRARWIGTTAADGSGSGTYTGRWHEGPKPKRGHHHHRS
jgi:hypothetical protein